MRIAVLYKNKYAKRWQGVKFSKAIADCLRCIGHEAMVHCDEVHGNYDLVIVVTRRGLWPGIKDVRCPIVVYNHDPLLGRVSIQRWVRNFRNLSGGLLPSNITGIIDHLPGNAESFKTMGVTNRVVCPHGWHWIFEHGRSMQSADVGFLGLNPPGSRRRHMLETLRKDFSVNIFPDPDREHPWSHSASTEDIANCLDSKIWLHIANEFDEKEGLVVNRCFNQQRAITFGMCNTRCVLHETCDQIPKGMWPGKHFMMADYDMIPYMVGRLLENDDWRESVAVEGYRFIRERSKMIDHWRTTMMEVEKWLG